MHRSGAPNRTRIRSNSRGRTAAVPFGSSGEPYDDEAGDDKSRSSALGHELRAAKSLLEPLGPQLGQQQSAEKDYRVTHSCNGIDNGRVRQADREEDQE